MQVTIQVTDFPFSEEADIPAVNPTCPLVQLVTAVAATLNQHPALREATPLIHTASYPYIDFPCDLPSGPLSVELMLASRTEVMALWGMSEDTLGAFLTSGEFLEDEESFYARRFRVIVPCDGERLRGWLKEARSLEVNPDSDMHDHENLMAYLTTVTHEMAHALDFIRHAGGLTPHEVDLLHDAGDLDIDLHGGCTGMGVRPDMASFHATGDIDGASEAMEERVEAQGRDWLDWVMPRLDKTLIAACLNEYAPN